MDPFLTLSTKDESKQAPAELKPLFSEDTLKKSFRRFKQWVDAQNFEDDEAYITGVMKHLEEFPGLWPGVKQIFLRTIAVSPSQCGVERDFSRVTDWKGAKRNRLSVPVLNMLLAIKAHGPRYHTQVSDSDWKSIYLDAFRRILYEHDKTNLYIRKPKPQFRPTTQTTKFADAESAQQQRQIAVKQLDPDYKPSSIFRGKYTKAQVASLASTIIALSPWR